LNLISVRYSSFFCRRALQKPFKVLLVKIRALL
jgi:hypothetical protein